MSAEIRPWYRWHWHRYRTSDRVAKMTLAEQGAYRNLLDAMWERGCSLPNDREILWRLALAKTEKEYLAVADKVEAMFVPTEDGQGLTNSVLTEEWIQTDEYLDSKRKAGAAGAKKRWQKDSTAIADPSQTDGTAIADPSQTDGTAIADPSSTHIAEGGTPIAINSSSSSSSSNTEKKEPPSFDSGVEVAFAFMEEFRLSGIAIRQAAGEAVDLRMKLTSVPAMQCCEELIAEYHKYLESQPEYKKSPKTWLAECNIHIVPRRVTKWVEISDQTKVAHA